MICGRGRGLERDWATICASAILNDRSIIGGDTRCSPLSLMKMHQSLCKTFYFAPKKRPFCDNDSSRNVPLLTLLMACFSYGFNTLAYYHYYRCCSCFIHCCFSLSFMINMVCGALRKIAILIDSHFGRACGSKRYHFALATAEIFRSAR